MENKEIIKALRCLCGDEIPCKTCAYNQKIFVCRKNVAIDALDLINRQRAKIEALKMDNEQLQSDIINANMNLEHQQEEIERLKCETGKLLPKDCHYAMQVEVSNKLEAQIKLEAVREFAERQIPKKPKLKYGEPTNTHRLGRLVSFHCPNCGKFILALYETDPQRGGGICQDVKGCSRCLQAIDFTGLYHIDATDDELELE